MDIMNITSWLELHKVLKNSNASGRNEVSNGLIVCYCLHSPAIYLYKSNQEYFMFYFAILQIAPFFKFYPSFFLPNFSFILFFCIFYSTQQLWDYSCIIDPRLWGLSMLTPFATPLPALKASIASCKSCNHLVPINFFRSLPSSLGFNSITNAFMMGLCSLKHFCFPCHFVFFSIDFYLDCHRGIGHLMVPQSIVVFLPYCCHWSVFFFSLTYLGGIAPKRHWQFAPWVLQLLTYSNQILWFDVVDMDGCNR